MGQGLLEEQLQTADFLLALFAGNGSTDGSTAAVNAFAANVRLARNNANVGFAAGVNQGLLATQAPYVLIMNPDCRLMATTGTTRCAHGTE